MGEGIQVKDSDEGHGIQMWGTAKNPSTWKGAGVDTNCCPCDCGCPDFENCLVPGEFLIATISSDCEDIDGMVKYFVVGEGDTHNGNGCWTAVQDNAYGDCLVLNPGGEGQATLICCDNGRDYCPDAQGCMRYYLVLRAYECDDQAPQIICATSCDCGESGKGFYLNFDGIVLDGAPRQGSPPPDPPPVYYLCGCDCEWPVTINIHVERLLECCCPNLESPANPTLTATIVAADGETCAGTMEGADTTLSHDSGSPCRQWTSDTPLQFHCDDDVFYELSLLLKCPQVEEGAISGGCCDDFTLDVAYGANCEHCDDEYAAQTAGVVGDCECLPLYLKFGPFKLWTDPGDSGCECCEEFYIVVTSDV